MAFHNLGFSFVPASLGPLTDGAGKLPLGTHPVEIVSAEAVGNKTEGSGGQLLLGIKIFDGPSKGVEGVHRLNIWHANETPRKIALETLAKIAWCCGRQNADLNQLQVLAGGRYVINVGMQDGDNPNQYTEIKSFTDMNGAKPYAPGGGQAAQSSNPYGAGGAPTGQAPQSFQPPQGQPQQSFQPPQGGGFDQGQGQAPQGGQPSWTPPGGQPQGQQGGQPSFQAPQQGQGGGPAWTPPGGGGQPQGGGQPTWGR